MLRSTFFLTAALTCFASSPSFAADSPAPSNKKAKHKVEFRIVEEKPAPGLIEAEIKETGRKIYLHKEIVATNKDIANARIGSDPQGKPTLNLAFTDKASEKIAQVTEKNRGKQLAILINGKIIFTPIIREKISRSTVMSGNFTEKELAEIVKAFNAD